MAKRKPRKVVNWGRGKHRAARVQRFGAKHPDSAKKVKPEAKQ